VLPPAVVLPAAPDRGKNRAFESWQTLQRLVSG
jgi:hypothetical protein